MPAKTKQETQRSAGEKQPALRKPEDRTEAELKQIASDLYHGRVFCDRQVHDVSLLSLVFMPLAFMDNEQLDELKTRNPGMIFARLEDAAPRCINGMPMFFSCETLSQKETRIVLDYVEKLRAAEKSVLEPQPSNEGA